MSNEDGLERAYPYRAGWRVACCSAIFLGIPGVVGAALLPFGCQQVRNGPLPLGIALVVIGLFTVPMLMFATLSLVFGVRDALSPPLLRVTVGSLILPSSLREYGPEEERDEETDATSSEKTRASGHPETIPFESIRLVHREVVSPATNRLIIAYDLSNRALVIDQSMMEPADFDELESVLRSAMPIAFVPAPSPQ